MIYIFWDYLFYLELTGLPMLFIVEIFFPYIKCADGSKLTKCHDKLDDFLILFYQIV
jgi:hypothetical protein